MQSAVGIHFIYNFIPGPSYSTCHNNSPSVHALARLIIELCAAAAEFSDLLLRSISEVAQKCEAPPL